MSDFVRFILLLVYIVLNAFLFIYSVFNHNARTWARVMCFVLFILLNAVVIYGLLNWWFV